METVAELAKRSLGSKPLKISLRNALISRMTTERSVPEVDKTTIEMVLVRNKIKYRFDLMAEDIDVCEDRGK